MTAASLACGGLVSISQSRCLSFQGRARARGTGPRATVSISQSRCLSFQAFRNRRRNAPNGLSFNLAIEMLVISGYMDLEIINVEDIKVSISQSRCLSFQVLSRAADKRHRLLRFNLAIEMLVISGEARAFTVPYAKIVSISQSRCLSFQVSTAVVMLPSRT